MTDSRGILLAAAVLALTLADCAKKKPTPAVPPPPVTKARRTPRAPDAATPPIDTIPDVPVRPPLALESRTDPMVDPSSVSARIRSVQSMLAQLNTRSLTGSAKDDRNRVAAMLDVAGKALRAGDVHQANDVSQRAETLAKALLNAR